jgi:hypothetical protein
MVWNKAATTGRGFLPEAITAPPISFTRVSGSIILLIAQVHDYPWLRSPLMNRTVTRFRTYSAVLAAILATAPDASAQEMGFSRRGAE